MTIETFTYPINDIFKLESNLENTIYSPQISLSIKKIHGDIFSFAGMDFNYSDKNDYLRDRHTLLFIDSARLQINTTDDDLFSYDD